MDTTTASAKSQQYQLLLQQVRQFAAQPVDIVSLLANTAALLHHSFGFWWTGFYRVAGDELILSAFQGPVACTNIPYGKGVCGTAWKERRTIVVPDVKQFPGHIACSSQSRSEIVVPIFSTPNANALTQLHDNAIPNALTQSHNNAITQSLWAVLDIDSEHLSTFDDTDRLYLEQLATILSDAHASLYSPIRDIYLAGGCFWGTQHYLSLLRGVLHAEAGYANGNIPNPTYEQVYTDTTGFAETVHVRYDASQISLSRLLEMFFKTIDPTSLNRQAHDIGTRYRTGIYFTDPDDLPVIRHSLKKLANNYFDPLVVEVAPLTVFYIAEEYHQDYLQKHPDGYCHIPLDLMSEARNFNPPNEN